MDLLDVNMSHRVMSNEQQMNAMMERTTSLERKDEDLREKLNKAFVEMKEHHDGHFNALQEEAKTTIKMVKDAFMQADEGYKELQKNINKAYEELHGRYTNMGTKAEGNYQKTKVEFENNVDEVKVQFKIDFHRIIEQTEFLYEQSKQTKAAYEDLCQQTKASVENLERVTQQNQYLYEQSQLSKVAYDNLYQQCKVTFEKMQTERAMNINDGTPRWGKPKCCLPQKSLVPKRIGDKMEEWRIWKDDFKDFVDQANPGYAKLLELMEQYQGMEDKDQVYIYLDDYNRRMGTSYSEADSVEIWRTLKRLTEGIALKILLSVKAQNGALAWLKLNQHYEPGLASQQGAALNELTKMSNTTAKNEAETRKMLIEYTTKIAFVEEISGKLLDETHKKAVLLGFMDDETRKHTVNFHGADKTDKELCNEMLKFVNGVIKPATATGAVPMQIGSMQQAPEAHDGAAHLEADQWPGGQWPDQNYRTFDYGQGYQPDGGEPQMSAEALEALGALKGGKKGGGKGGKGPRVCHGCGAPDHFIANCPMRGKSIGKGQGYRGFQAPGFPAYPTTAMNKGNYNYQKGQTAKGNKGGGKGGPRGGCWKCGGPHYADNCDGSGHRQGQVQGQVRVLASFTEVERKNPKKDTAKIKGPVKIQVKKKADEELKIQNKFQVLERADEGGENEETLICGICNEIIRGVPTGECDRVPLHYGCLREKKEEEERRATEKSDRHFQKQLRRQEFRKQWKKCQTAARKTPSTRGVSADALASLPMGRPGYRRTTWETNIDETVAQPTTHNGSREGSFLPADEPGTAKPERNSIDTDDAEYEEKTDVERTDVPDQEMTHDDEDSKRKKRTRNQRRKGTVQGKPVKMSLMELEQAIESKAKSIQEELDEHRGETKKVTILSKPIRREKGFVWKENVEVSKRKTNNLNPFITIEPEGFNAINDHDGWELITMYVDSGATETVITEQMLALMELKESLQSRRGVEYEVANGVKISNL